MSYLLKEFASGVYIFPRLYSQILRGLPAEMTSLIIGLVCNLKMVLITDFFNLL
jgi:hypothetical protein